MSFSRKIASYFPRPRLRSQTTMSMTGPTIGAACIICRGREGVQGGFELLGLLRIWLALIRVGKPSSRRDDHVNWWQKVEAAEAIGFCRDSLVG